MHFGSIENLISIFIHMKKITLLFIICAPGFFLPGLSQSVQFKYEESFLKGSYAERVLVKALKEKGYTIKEAGADYTIDLLINMDKHIDEGYYIVPKGHLITIVGYDLRGLIYGSLEITEAVRNGTSLKDIKGFSNSPHYALRAIKFDLPWDTYRHSYSLDQHQETCKDLHFWEAFLDMMVENRFNALSLWNLHPYPYMIKPKNFPEATPFNDKELKEWQDLFHGIFRMAAERGIDTYLIPFNIFVSPEFAKAHHVAMDNLEHHFFVNGDTSAIIKQYTRECVTQVLEEYPDLTGFGLTLGEGMGGMTPQQREDWMKETIIEGMRRAHRQTPMKLVHRIPFSSSTGSYDTTSIQTEILTRKAIDEEGSYDFIQAPIFADLKYNWSHAHSTPTLVKVHGGKLFDTYFKPEPTKYKITWTARNEDFFCLRWGVPDFIRKHIAANSQRYVGGYFLGSETYIPAKDYFTAITGPVSWKYAFERQWLFYKLWGRLLYDPETPDSIFANEFVYRYGKNGKDLLRASSLVGKTPLRLASSFDLGWDFTLYSEGFLALNPATKNVEYISVNRQINQPPLDPNYVSVKDYVKAMSSGGAFAKEKVTPPILVDMLEKDCNEALKIVSNINTEGNNDLMYEVSDIKVWANLGLYFAQKLRGAVALQEYRTKGNELKKQEAIKFLEQALQYWDIVVSITRPIYKDMPLVHYSEQGGTRSKENDKLRFHWEKTRPAVAKDIEIARQAIVIEQPVNQ